MHTCGPIPDDLCFIYVRVLMTPTTVLHVWKLIQKFLVICRTVRVFVKLVFTNACILIKVWCKVNITVIFTMYVKLLLLVSFVSLVMLLHLVICGVHARGVAMCSYHSHRWYYVIHQLHEPFAFRFRVSHFRSGLLQTQRCERCGFATRSGARRRISYSPSCSATGRVDYYRLIPLMY